MTRHGLFRVCALFMAIMLGCIFAFPLAAFAQPTPQAATFPFSDDFEAATLGSNWSVTQANSGKVLLDTNYVHGATQSVFLGQKESGYATASLVLAVNLQGQSEVFLDYWTRTVGFGEYYRVYISDGGEWKEIRNFDSLSQNFSHVVLDIAKSATDKGLSLNNQFRILFQYDSLGQGDAGDAVVIDDLRLTDRASVQAQFPFNQDSFEIATLPVGFHTYGYNSGLVELTKNHAHSGSQSIFLGQKIGGYATASLTLFINLQGQNDVFLDLWTRTIGFGEYYRIYISDGGDWQEIRNYDSLALSFSHIVIDVSKVAIDKGLSLNNQFRILFQYDSLGQGDAGDGIIIDDLRLSKRADNLTVFPMASDSFEGDMFPQGFYPYSYGLGAIELSSDYVHTGGKGVFIGQKVYGYASADLIMALDLTNQQQVYLDFWARRVGDGEYYFISLSDNLGGRWVNIYDLGSLKQTFAPISINIADVAQKNGLSLNNQVLVAISYSSTGAGDANDGLVIDDLGLRNAQIAPGPSYIVNLPYIKR